jgi:hypothetical protein
MTEKEIKGYMIEKIGEIKKETECDDCILFIGKDSVGKMCAGIDNEAALVEYIWQMVRAYGSLGENPLTRRTLILRKLTQHLIDEIKEEFGETEFSQEIDDLIPKETEDDPTAEEDMAKRISKRWKPEAEDDPSVEK